MALAVLQSARQPGGERWEQFSRHTSRTTAQVLDLVRAARDGHGGSRTIARRAGSRSVRHVCAKSGQVSAFLRGH
jgi:hypothetical protein